MTNTGQWRESQEFIIPMPVRVMEYSVCRALRYSLDSSSIIEDFDDAFFRISRDW